MYFIINVRIVLYILDSMLIFIKRINISFFNSNFHQSLIQQVVQPCVIYIFFCCNRVDTISNIVSLLLKRFKLVAIEEGEKCVANIKV